jgi:nucleotide-binding universal stress UspA family protein
MAHTYLKQVAQQLEKQEIKVSTAVRIGPVAETIVQFAKTNDIDLIAMATHGRTGMARWTLGSVAAQVLREGSTPVFLVRSPRRELRH